MKKPATKAEKLLQLSRRASTPSSELADRDREIHRLKTELEKTKAELSEAKKKSKPGDFS